MGPGGGTGRCIGPFQIRAFVGLFCVAVVHITIGHADGAVRCHVHAGPQTHHVAEVAHALALGAIVALGGLVAQGHGGHFSPAPGPVRSGDHQIRAAANLQAFCAAHIGDERRVAVEDQIDAGQDGGLELDDLFRGGPGLAVEQAVADGVHAHGHRIAALDGRLAKPGG